VLYSLSQILVAELRLVRPDMPMRTWIRHLLHWRPTGLDERINEVNIYAFMDAWGPWIALALFVASLAYSA